MLQKLGVSALQQKIYLALIDDPSITPAQLARSQRSSIKQVQRELATLAEIGLVSRGVGGTTYLVAPPEAAIRSLIHREAQALEQIHAHASSLARRLRSARQRFDVGSIVEIVVGTSAIGARWEQAQRQAQQCIRIIDRPPYHIDTAQNLTERELIAQGVAYKTIYDADIMEAPDHLERARECMTWGEEARMLADAPIKIAIVDQALLLLMLVDEAPTQEAAAVLVHPSVLFDSLLELYEQLWRRATPLLGNAAAADVSRDNALLNLLAAGLKDEAIAQTLGLSVRTVRRDIRELCEQFGVRSRFQAGVVAKERGLI
jgi:DNA-binding CsgD family transcriptional regulator